MIAIGTDRTGKPKGRVAWHKIRAEYIQGTSQAKLAKKYHVSRTSIAYHCRKEGWTEDRENAKAEVAQRITQKTAESAADNAVIAQRIKRKLLLKLEREIDALPDLIGSGKTQSDSDREYKGNNLVKVKDTITNYKLKDLTAAYKDLTADMAQPDEQGNALLESLMTLERRSGHD